MIALGAVAVFALVVLLLPAIQALGYALIVGTPELLWWGGIGLVVIAVGTARGSEPTVGLGIVIIVVMGVFVGPVAGGAYTSLAMADDVEGDATQLDTLPNTSQENVRILPRSVADNYAQSSLQSPQYRLTESDMAYSNGTYRWSYGMAPDNFVVSLMGHQTGAMFVDMTRVDKAVTMDETDFDTGRGQLVFDSYDYQSVLASPLKSHQWDTTFNAEVNGSSYIAHSTIEHEWRFRLLPIPQPYAVPTHGSVEIMHPDGTINTLSPTEATESDLLRGQNVYPYDLAVKRVNSMRYRHGAFNAWFAKEDVLQIADLPEGGNEWPIAVPTEAATPELTYFVATEPTGSGNGVFEVWTIDGQSGEMGVQRYNESQLGPQKAVDFVERRPEVNRLSNAHAVAPVPVVKGDTLFWHVKVVPRSESGIVYTAFVNAESGDVTLVEGTEPIYAFLSEGEVEAIQNATAGTNGMTVTVVVTDANGSIVGTQNVTVPEGGGFEVSATRPSSTASNQTGGDV